MTDEKDNIAAPQEDAPEGSLARIKAAIQAEYSANEDGDGDPEVSNYLGGLAFALAALEQEQALRLAEPDGNPLGRIILAGTREEFERLDGINIEGVLYMSADWVKEKTIKHFVQVMHERLDGLSTLEELHKVQAQARENFQKYFPDGVSGRPQPQAS